MNCKPGDIAVVIAGVVENVGRLVHVERAYGLVDYAHKGYGMLHCWVVTPLDRLVKNTFGDLVDVAYIPDIALRPLPKQTTYETIDELEVIAHQMEEQEEALNK